MRHLLLLGALALTAPALAGDPPATAKEVITVPIQDIPVVALDGAPFDRSQWAGKVALVVNVASRCGYTKQYAALQALYEQRKAQGFVIVGVPCNQFGGQEPGSAEEIATFCSKNFGVTFPLLEKQDVNGAGRSPLYAALVGDGKDIGWNFEKFVVGKDGKVAARFPSSTTPDSAELAAAIDAALAR